MDETLETTEFEYLEEPTNPTTDELLEYEYSKEVPSDYAGSWEYANLPENYMSAFSGVFSIVILVIGVLSVVDLILRGLALWKSAQQKEKVWFILLLIINSLGILPGIYLLTHKNKSETPKVPTPPTRAKIA